MQITKIPKTKAWKEIKMTDSETKIKQPTVIEILPLFMWDGFIECEIWKESDYRRVHYGTKKKALTLDCCKENGYIAGNRIFK